MTTADRQTAIPARGWEQDVPLYKATRDVHPPSNSRMRHEPPFSSFSDPDCAQFCERPIKAGEEFESKSWPHPSYRALNRSAEAVLAFFNSAPKSRLGLSPWRGDRIVLDDGLSGRTQPNIKIGATAK
jgi:hypothetical protein